MYASRGSLRNAECSTLHIACGYSTRDDVISREIRNAPGSRLYRHYIHYYFLFFIVKKSRHRQTEFENPKDTRFALLFRPIN